MIMESTTGFSSPRTDAFPAGLRVLVVDDDPTWLKILEKMLKKCSYEVTTCGLAREALDLLRERKDGFDIVISDVNMPDMDGFKLLEHVGLEMDLPVIMMSVDGETSRVMKGVQHGACDYLLKPIRMKELRNIWQHVFRKRIHEVRDGDSQDGFEDFQMMRTGSDYTDDAYLFSGTNLSSGKKRKDDDKEYSDTSSAKKARVVWSIELHQKFVKAVNQIGFDKVGPKKILDLMNVPGLTRENVASHLQKYRLYLSRLQKENEMKASFGGVNCSVLSPRDPPGNACLQNLLNMQQNDSGSKHLIKNVDCKVHEGGKKGIVSVRIAEPMKAPSANTSDSKKTSNAKMAFNHSFHSPNSEVYSTTILSQYPWTAEYSQMQFKQESNSHLHLENKFNHLPLPRLQVDCKQPSPSFVFRSSSSTEDKLYNLEDRPSCIERRSQGIAKTSQAEHKVDAFFIQPELDLTNSHSFEPILLSNQGSAQRNDAFLGKDLHGYSPQGDFQPISIGLENVECFDYNDPELLAAIPPSAYEALKYDYEYPFDSMEYPVMDQSLFIV